MSDLEKAARLALEALEQLQGGCTDSNDGTMEAITVWCPEVIAALRQALSNSVEQPAQQQEPVYFCDYGYEGWGKVDAVMAAENLASGMTVEAYYTSPQPAQQQEPVAVARVDDLERGGRVRALAMGLSLDAPLYTSPQPSKPWVGLTDKERDEIYNTHEPYADLKAIEAKLREKNT